MKVFLAAAVVAAALMPGGDNAMSVQVGDPAPDFTAKWVEAASPAGKLSDLQGKVVLVEFWRTW